MTPRSVAAVGDVADPACWSGIPYFFHQASCRAGFATEPVRLNLDFARWGRRRWGLRRTLAGRRPRGYQYSREFLDRAESQIPPAQLAGEVISLSQHFPRAASVVRAGGSVSYYIDATFAAMSDGRGLDLDLPRDVVDDARTLERENYRLATRVVAMASWTARSLVEECGVPAGKVAVIAPGANFDLPAGWAKPERVGRAGVDRPFVLGFVGKDWERKGLPVVCEVRDRLAAGGWKATVLAAGDAPPSLAGREGVEFVGFLDKRQGTGRFVEFLSRADVGCLFSKREALGISTLEFLRVGVPVAGYAVEGPADTIPADAGFRFAPADPPEAIAARLADYLSDEAGQRRVADAALRHAEAVTWDRCVREFQALWARGAVNDH